MGELDPLNSMVQKEEPLSSGRKVNRSQKNISGRGEGDEMGEVWGGVLLIRVSPSRGGRGRGRGTGCG